jgi:cytochrome c553
MKKMVIIALAILVFASLAMAQNPTYTRGTGIQGIDKLGAHQNGGRGCVGCHAPHSGARGNGGVWKWNDTSKQYESVPVEGVVGDEVLWGQDLSPIYALGSLAFPDTEGGSGTFAVSETSPERIITGVVMCLSCHDGNVARGGMMSNVSFEQASGLLPPTYGAQPIPTLLGADGGSFGNYKNDHPVGPTATLGAVGHGAIGKYFDLDSGKTRVILKATQPDTKYSDFMASYGSPLISGSRTGAGFAVDSTMTSSNQAYVVCTTCHTPHSMYTASASATNPIAGLTAGVFPSYFFLAAPYNPGADTAGGTRASSATQFCRQCHFSGPGGANEASGIKIPTSF